MYQVIHAASRAWIFSIPTHLTIDMYGKLKKKPGNVGKISLDDEKIGKLRKDVDKPIGGAAYRMT